MQATNYASHCMQRTLHQVCIDGCLQVVNLRGVTVAGAVLESTTLVFSYGTDMFYTRMSPAQNFDSLQSDFSYGLLVVALVALLVGTWVASYSSQQAMLKGKWQ